MLARVGFPEVFGSRAGPARLLVLLLKIKVSRLVTKWLLNRPACNRPLKQHVGVSTTSEGLCPESKSEQFQVFNRILHILESRCCHAFI